MTPVIFSVLIVFAHPARPWAPLRGRFATDWNAVAVVLVPAASPCGLQFMSFKSPYTFISARQLAAMVKTEGKVLGKDFAIVDVRDDDYAGGHIKGAIHQSSKTLPHGGVEEIREKTKDVPSVVFHCLLSQVRGPESARLYAASTAELRRNGGRAPIDQEILVLRGGFIEFQSLYKDDKDLVEDYDPTVWGN